MLLSSAQLAEREKKNLASYAVASVDSEGRLHKEKSRKDRLCFQLDKDRIIHSKAFRRLDKKTQVFSAGSGDHFRTRLTHTIEVAKTSRDIARRLGLNEDLAETIALAHDLGHPPFGHAGEDALDEVMKKYGSHFEHNEQSRRVVEKLEKPYPGFDGLNLSLEVLDGMIKHITPWDQAGRTFEVSANLEAQIVNIADEIAYTTHDIDDGLRAGYIKVKEIEKLALWKKAAKEVRKTYGVELSGNVLISRMVSRIISLMIQDLCAQTDKNIRKYKIKTVRDVKKEKKQIARFSPSMNKMVQELRMLLMKKFYLHKDIRIAVDKGKKMIVKLFNYYYKHPEDLPRKKHLAEEEITVQIKDYIAGMTDSFLIQEYEKFIMKR